jgi:lipid A 3-O-deacylase
MNFLPRFRRVSLLVLFALGAATGARAEPPRFATFTFDNDFFAGDDRHYTNGMQLAFVTDVAKAPALLREHGPLAWSTEAQAVVAIGQRIYTPANTDITVPDPGERPYAGWLYLMTDVETRAAPTLDHLTLTLGMVGPAAGARQMQDIVHNVLGEVESRGWDTQLRNRATFMAAYERAWPGIASGGFGGHRWDLATRVAASLGTPMTYTDAGAVLRFGRNLPADLPVTHISLGPARDGFRGTTSFGWYAWAGADARAVAYNTFIDGNSFSGGPHPKREPFGFDLQMGIAAAWPTARVGFMLLQRSREFEGQVGPDRYGQLAISFAY